MNLFAIARTEWMKRRLLWIGAPWVWAVAWVGPMLHGHSGTALVNAQVGTAVVMGLTVSAVLGLYFGSSMLNRDLREGRAGFFFSLPLHPIELLAGKLLGAWTLSAFAGLVVVVPILLVTHSFELNAGIGVLLLIPLVTLLSGHVFFFILSARTAWIGLDVLSLAGGCLGSWMWIHQLQATSQWGLEGMVTILFAALMVLFLIGSIVQITQGRVDVHRGHKAMSLTFAGGLVILGLVGILHLRWTRELRTRDLQHVDLIAPAQVGPWVGIHGTKRSMQGLVNMETGKGLRTGTTPLGGPVMSADGSRAIWMAPAGFTESALWTAQLHSEATGVRRVGSLGCEGFGPAQLALSPQGTRAALLGPSGLRIMDIATGADVAVESLPGLDLRRPARILFISETTLRLYASFGEGSSTLEIREWDQAQGRLRRTGTMALGSSNPWATQVLRDRDPCTDRLLALLPEGEEANLWCIHGRTGERMRSLAHVRDGERVAGVFLSDGSIVWAHQGSQGLDLRALDQAGNPRWAQHVDRPWVVPKGGSGRLWWSQETAPGRLVLHAPGGEASDAGCLDVDVYAGRWKAISCEAAPGFQWRDPLQGPARPGGWASRVRVEAGQVKVVGAVGSLTTPVDEPSRH